MIWQRREARQRFSALVQRALDEGPQVVTRNGEAVVAVMAISEYEQLRQPKSSFAEFLLNAPDFSPLDLTRDQSVARIVEL